MPTAPRRLEPGAASPVLRVGPITPTLIVRYAGAGGDFNPIHHDESFARAAGMPGIFSMGMLQAGLLGTLVSRWLGVGNVRTFSVRFTGQVWPGDELTLRGAVESVDRSGEESLATCDLVVARGDEVVVSGRATVVAAAHDEQTNEEL